jgi:MFS family permease
LGALNVTILGDLYRGAERTTAMGYNASVLSVGTGLYPALGGALAVFGWYFPFFLPLLAIPVALAVLFMLDNPEPHVTGKLGEYLRETMRAALRPQVLTLFAAGVVTFVLIYGPYLTFFPFLLTQSFDASPVFIGVVMSVTSLATGVAAYRLGALAARFSERSLVKAGFALYVAALATIPLASNVWLLGVPILLFGVANGINVPSFLAILSGYAPTEYRAAFMSLNGTVLRLGQTVGPVLFGVIYVVFGLPATFYAGGVLALGMVGLLHVAFGDGVPPKAAR